MSEADVKKREPVIPVEDWDSELVKIVCINDARPHDGDAGKLGMARGEVREVSAEVAKLLVAAGHVRFVEESK
jgi:hypothetical protein